MRGGTGGEGNITALIVVCLFREGIEFRGAGIPKGYFLQRRSWGGEQNNLPLNPSPFDSSPQAHLLVYPFLGSWELTGLSPSGKGG